MASRKPGKLFSRTRESDVRSGVLTVRERSGFVRVFAALIVAVLIAAGIVYSPFGEGAPSASAQQTDVYDNRLVGGYAWDASTNAPADNPAMPQKCGLNIAMVFDLSNSIGRAGLMETRNAGRQVVNALKGTPTTIGLFNFGTEAPVPTSLDWESLDMQREGDVTRAINTINGYQYGQQSGRDFGGANWEGALKNVNNSSVKYDVVYFVTASVPTTNDDRIPENIDGRNWDGYTGDPGRVAHNYDIVSAIRQANLLKESGTRIETLAVGNFTSEVRVLKDDVRFTGPSGLTQYGPYLHVPPRAFTLDVPRDFAYSYSLAPRNPWTLQFAIGVYHQLRLGTISNIYNGTTNYWYRVEDEVGAVRTGFDTPTLYVYDRNGNTIGYWNPEWLYRPNRKTGVDILKSISGDDLQILSSYSGLAAALKKAATENCEGTLTVEKQIVDEKGNVQNVSAEGWEFTSNIEGPISQQLPDVDPTNNPLTGKTGRRGKLTYKFTTPSPHQNGYATVTETQKDGFTLHSQGGQNATCTAVDIANGAQIGTRELEYSNAGDLGFKVKVSTGWAVHCVVQNAQNTFHVSKTPHQDHFKETDSDRAQATIEPNGEVTAKYNVSVTNNRSNTTGQPEGGDKLDAPVRDKVTFPEGMTVKSVRFFFGNRDVTEDVEKAEDGAYEISPEIFGGFNAEEKKTVEVRVTAKVSEDTQTAIADGTYEKCESATPPNVDNPRSMFNAVTLKGEVQGENPERDNQACVDPVLQHVAFTVQKVDAEDKKSPLDGAEFTLFAAEGKDLGVGENGIPLLAGKDENGEVIPGRLVLPEDAALRPGKYVLQETKAPSAAGGDGPQYSLLPRPIEFELTYADGQSTVVLAKEDNGESPWFAAVDKADDPSIIKVFNVQAGELPKTGGFGVWWIAGLGALLAAAGLIVGRGRRA